MTLVATVAASESLDDFRLLALGTFANFAPLVASTATFEGYNDFRLLALGTFANFAPLIAAVTDRSFLLVPGRNWSDLSTYRALFVSGKVFSVAVFAS